MSRRPFGKDLVDVALATSPLRFLGPLSLAVFSLVETPRLGFALCPDPAALADARAQVAAQCDCAGSTHAAYVRCATRIAADLVSTGALPSTCKAKVRRCAVRSV